MLRRFVFAFTPAILFLWIIPSTFARLPLFPKSPAEDKFETLLRKLEEKVEVDLSKPLTLRECIEVALKRSTRVRLSEMEVTLAELSLDDARARYFPQIYLDGTYMFSDKVEFGFEEENYDLWLRASYTIWDHGHREAEVAQRRAEAEAARNRYEEEVQRLIYNVTVAYYNLLKMKKLVEVDEEILRIARMNTEKTRAFMEAGYKVEADVLAAEVREANDELKLIEDQNNLKIAKANLAMAMGLDPGTEIEVVEDRGYERFVVTGRLEPEEITLEEAIKKALENRPELKEMRAQIKAMEWGVYVAKLDRYPRITAEYGYNVDLDDYLRERENFKSYRSWQAVAKLTFPLFDAGSSKRRVQQLEIQLRKLRENLESLERQIALEVRECWYDLMRIRKSLEVLDKQVRNAKMSLDAALGRYEQQLITEIEVAEARSLYAQALTNRVHAYYDYKIAQAALKKAMGVLR